jgi:hypothetical protein
LEDRWEVLASCEKRFAKAAARVSIGNIAQAEAANGQVLIRLGETPHADLARFRYVDTALAADSRRFQKILLKAVLLLSGNATLVLFGIVSTVGAVKQSWPHMATIFSCAVVGGVDVIVVRLLVRLGFAAHLRMRFMTVQTDDGPAVMRWNQVRFLRICSSIRDRSWSLRIVHEKGESEFKGPVAEFYLGVILSRLPHPIYNQSDLNAALQLIAAQGGASAFLESFAFGRADASNSGEANCVGLMQSPWIYRLAATIAVDERRDRSETEAGIESLRETATSAGEIAGIADDLLLPGAVINSLANLRRKLTKRSAMEGQSGDTQPIVKTEP